MPAPFVRPDVQAFLDRIAAAGGEPLYALGVVEARRVAAEMMAQIDLPPAPLAVMRDVAVPGAPGPARLYDMRETRGPGPVVLFVHGGGFVVGAPESYDAACAEIARALDLPVVAIRYRLAPEHVWPAAPDDCEAAARWLAGSPAGLGRAVTALVLAGDSAGGNLATVTALALRDRPAEAPVLALFSLYPVADFSRSYRSEVRLGADYLLTVPQLAWYRECYRPDPADWRASPLLARQEGMPPTLILTAGLDPLLDHGRAHAAALLKAGVTVQYREARGMIHGLVNLRRAVPSAAGDFAGALRAFAAMVAEAVAEV